MTLLMAVTLVLVVATLSVQQWMIWRIHRRTQTVEQAVAARQADAPILAKLEKSFAEIRIEVTNLSDQIHTESEPSQTTLDRIHSVVFAAVAQELASDDEEDDDDETLGVTKH